MANSETNRTITVQVNLSDRSYPILIGRNIAKEITPLVQTKFPKTRHAVVLFDEHVQSIADRATEGLSDGGWRISQLKIPSGETSKSIAQADRLWNAMLAERTDRGSIVVAVGGGVVGDLAGFMAATFARGLPLVQIPTTLLSQVDSSVGGKTGINLPGAKNIVGAFWQPSAVLIDSATLDSLPRREFISGLAEVAKYGVILLPQLFEYLESQHASILDKAPDAIEHIVAESCRAKAQVVEQDERETSGLRAILNYGHTFAHAIESVSGYGALLHGEAVAIGMHMAALLAQRLERVDQEFVRRQKSLLQCLELPTSFANADPLELWQVMQHDKKVEHGKLRFILPSQIGHVDLVGNVGQDDVCAAIEQANQG